jgi:hypothetical protein
MGLTCDKCEYDEDKDKDIYGEFKGIFANGTGFSTTDGEMCGLYVCPVCNTINFTTDHEYIRKRKEEFKKKMREKR